MKKTEPLYEDEASSDFQEQHGSSPTSAASSFSSAERVGQSRRRERSAHHHHGSQLHRYSPQQQQQQQDRQDAYPLYTRRQEVLTSTSRSHQQRLRSSSLSTDSDAHRDHHHHHHRHPEDADTDEDGYLFSELSGLPSLGVAADFTPAQAGRNAARSDEETSFVEDFSVPTWSQGSRLLERRILQAVDQETVELGDDDERGDHGHGHGGSVSSFWTFGLSHTLQPSMLGSGAAGARPQSGPPPLAPALHPPTPAPSSPSADVAAGSASFLEARPPLRPRMKEAALMADPRSRLLDLVITNTAGSVTLGEMEQAMRWGTQYEPTYGPLLAYLQSYQSIFVVSPVDDRVRLRRLFSIRTEEALRARASRSSLLLQQRRGSQSQLRRRSGNEVSAAHRSSSAADRRSGKPSLPSAEALAAHIGSVSYSCVGEHMKLDTLETVYRRRGYDTAMMYGVLHVTSKNDFHLFLFSSGAVVWWGMDRKEHWMVEDDFLAEATHIAEGVEHRYMQSEIEALFPIWCSFEVDEQWWEEDVQAVSPLDIQPTVVKPSLERLSKVLCFDHYLVPPTEPARSLIMLTFSHSLGRAARVDYFEYVTKWSHRHILSIPAEFSGLLDYFSTKQRIAKLEGEIEVAQLAIQSIHDTPEVLWEVPWLQAYYDMVEQQNTAQSRLSWFTSRSDTLLEQLSHIKVRRHRLFMLGSDVFLIVILILDVVFMTSRLVAKMYFKVEEDN